MIPDYIRQRFGILLRAADTDSICIREMRDKVTHEPVFLICAYMVDEEEIYHFTPLGEVSQKDNPFDAYVDIREVEDKDTTKPAS